MAPTPSSSLWLTIPGARGRVPLAWLCWTIVVACLAPIVAARLGAAGTMILVLGAGWLVARRVPAPSEWLRRYHVDDVEVTAMGPGPSVRRLPWSRVHTVTQERRTLTLVGDGTRISVPLAPLVRTRAWDTVLARIVPDLADELWTLLEEGEQVRLAPPLDPPSSALAWWAWAPAALAAGLGAGALGGWMGVLLVLCERGIALLRVQATAVTIHRAGVALRTWVRGIFASWPRAEVVDGPEGLMVGVTHGLSARVPRALPNFWAAAAVIQLKARLGMRANANVHFRVRVGEDGFAVVGEVEPSA